MDEDMRDKRGRFVEGNKVAAKPVKCPYCEREVSIRAYHYLDKNDGV